MERKRKSIAPQEHGELPNEKRCKQCWRLLGEVEDLHNNLISYCSYCGITYSIIQAQDRIKTEYNDEF